MIDEWINNDDGKMNSSYWALWTRQCIIPSLCIDLHMLRKYNMGQTQSLVVQLLPSRYESSTKKQTKPPKQLEYITEWLKLTI